MAGVVCVEAGEGKIWNEVFQDTNTLVVLTNTAFNRNLGWFVLDRRRHVSHNNTVVVDPTAPYYVIGGDIRPMAALELKLQALKKQAIVRSRSGRGVFAFVYNPASNATKCAYGIAEIATCDRLPDDASLQAASIALGNVLHDKPQSTWKFYIAPLIQHLADVFASEFVPTPDAIRELVPECTMLSQEFAVPFELGLLPIWRASGRVLFAKATDQCSCATQHCCFRVSRGRAHVCAGLMPRLLRSVYIAQLLTRIERCAKIAAVTAQCKAQAMVAKTDDAWMWSDKILRPLAMPHKVFSSACANWYTLSTMRIATPNLKTDTGKQTQLAGFFRAPTSKPLPPCIHGVVSTAIGSKSHLKNKDRMILGGFLGRVVSQPEIAYIVHTELATEYKQAGIPIPTDNLTSIVAVAKTAAGTPAVPCTYYVANNLCFANGSIPEKERTNKCCALMGRQPVDIEDCIVSPEFIATRKRVS